MADRREGRRPSLRPAGFDDLGLRRALSDRLLPLLVAAMAFLAALALAGAIAAASLARHWQQGAAASLLVQVPSPGAAGADGAAAAGPRVERVAQALRSTPGVAAARVMEPGELSDLLRPWLGSDAEAMALPLPAVIEVRLSDPTLDGAGLSAALDRIAPGTLVENQGTWVGRLSALARSLQACAALALLVVALVAAAVIAVATRAGLSARRESIEIVHGLGATDAYIAGRFAGRTTALAAAGGLAGGIAALPVLLGLAWLAAPFAGNPAAPGAAETAPQAGAMAVLASLPLALWLALPALPAAAAAIGWVTAQGTVRRWLRRLP
jgi:cell division transport system permease protein